MRRRDLLRPELMAVRPAPASAWPTIADIPQGAVVLDSDGVVKRKIGGGLVPVPITLVGSGPISSAPVASAELRGAMWYDETSVSSANPSGLWQCRGVFNNVGTDWIDCGVPTFITNYMRPGVDSFIVEAVAKKSSSVDSFGPLVETGTAGATRIFELAHVGSANNYALQANSGGVQYRNEYINVPVNIYHKYTLVSTPGANGCSVYYDGVLVGNFTSGLYSTITGMRFMGSPGIGIEYFDGKLASVRFFSVSSGLLDAYDFDLWNGTGSGMSQNGNAYTVTDGNPFTAKGYDWVPFGYLL